MSFFSNIKKRSLLKKIYKFISSHDYSKALGIIEELDESQLTKDIFYALSLIFFAQKDIQKAIKAIDNAIELDDKNPAFLVHKAKILQDLEQYEESIKLLESTDKLTVFNEEILYVQAINYLAINNLNRANEIFYEALKTIDKRFIESRFAMATELLLLKLKKNTLNSFSNNQNMEISKEKVMKAEHTDPKV